MLRAIAAIYLLVVGLIVCAVLGIIAFYAIAMLGYAVGRDAVEWLHNLVGGLAGLAVFAFAGRALWRLAHRKSTEPRSAAKSALVCAGWAALGACGVGGFMLEGTLFLGHLRATWMELSYVPEATLSGLVIGLLFGLALEYRRAAWR